MTAVVARALEASRTYRVGRGAVLALDRVTLEVPRGAYLAVVGPSGSGKSTLLHLLGAVDRPTGGQVELLGQRTDALGDDALARLRLRHVGFVFQRFFLLPMLSALENVMLPMIEAGVGARERRERAGDLLAYVGLDGRLEHRPGQLSGGEMQRVAIARALANRPELLLADEPTGELDHDSAEEVARLLDRLHADGTTVVLVTHNLDLARRAGTVVQMRDGRIVP